MDTALTWDVIARTRESWPRKLVVKGLLTVENCVRAAEIGADAVAISNHCGRQLNWAVAPLDLLPAVRRALGERVTIYVMVAFAAAPMSSRRYRSAPTLSLSGAPSSMASPPPARPGQSAASTSCTTEMLRDLGLLGVPRVAELTQRLLVRMSQLREEDMAY
jgi:(S)-mandelate dehydrogenase